MEQIWREESRCLTHRKGQCTDGWVASIISNWIMGSHGEQKNCHVTDFNFSLSNVFSMNWAGFSLILSVALGLGVRYTFQILCVKGPMWHFCREYSIGTTAHLADFASPSPVHWLGMALLLLIRFVGGPVAYWGKDGSVPEPLRQPSSCTTV